MAIDIVKMLEKELTVEPWSMVRTPWRCPICMKMATLELYESGFYVIRCDDCGEVDPKILDKSD